MSDPLSRPEDLYEAFAEAGFELERKVETPSRSIGFLAIKGAPSPIAETDLEDIDVAGADADISELVTGWERLTPSELAERHREFDLDPYVAVGEWVVPIDHNRIEAWLHGEYLARALADRPRLESRRIEIQQLRIVYMGASKAVATYFLVERFEDSAVVYSGNAAVILVHLREKGWRIACYTKAANVGT